MPSASAKIEKIASSEASDPVKQFVNTLEKRIRNLEKRKMKLDNYRSDVQNGKELNEDQKVAVSKYELVEGLLESARENSKSMNSVVLEIARQQKKMAKKEQIERQQHEIQRLQEAFMYSHILSSLQNDEVRCDFLTGENGAVLLTKEQLSHLDQLYKLIVPELPSEKADLTNHFHVLAENHIFLVEGKNKEVAGTTYKVLKELLQGVKESGYFSRSSEPVEEAVDSDDVREEENLVEREDPALINRAPEKAFAEIEDSGNESNVQCQASIPIESVPITGSLKNGPLQEVLSAQGSFNFLQESQIDLDTPHMDPAVVAVHQMAPPSAVPISVVYPSPAKEISQPIMNGGEMCENVMVQSPVAAQPALAAIPRTATPVLTSIQHGAQSDFDPSHPIPTQTFTNQSFAVMQNMMMSQPYVPVTIHHAPITPHITPMAVVPGLGSPITSTATPVVPVNVPMLTADPALDNHQPSEGEDLQEQQATPENGPARNDEINAADRNGNSEGQTANRGGYRG